MEGKGVASGFVQCALPPLFVGIRVPAETFRCDACATEVEDADLLTGNALEGVVAAHGCEKAVVGEHDALDGEVAVVAHEQ